MDIKTASDLKYMYEKLNPKNFFDRATMKFFGDTMSNYYVPLHKGKARMVQVLQSDGTIANCYALQRKRHVKGGLTATTYFCSSTFERVLGDAQ